MVIWMNRKEKSCETCRYDLGGGYDNCKLNLERECAEGGFEAWEPEEPDGREVYTIDPSGDENTKLWDMIIDRTAVFLQKAGMSFREAAEGASLFCALMRGCIRKRVLQKPRHKQIERAKALLRRRT